MIKRRKIAQQESTGDLADVNEQELAKDVKAGDVPSVMCAAENIESVNEAEPENNRQTVEATEQNTLSVLQTASDSSIENSIVPAEVMNTERRSHRQRAKKIRVEDAQRTQTPPRAPRKRKQRGTLYVAVMVTCLLIAITLIVGSALYDGEQQQLVVSDELTDTELTPPAAQDTQSRADRLGAEEIYALGARSTVTVAAAANGSTQYFSGFAVFNGGYVATLCEAVDGKSSVEIVTHDGTTFPAAVVGADRSVNLALLKTDAISLEGVKVGQTSSLGVGNSVFAIGNVGGGRYASSLLATQVAHCERSPLMECCDGVTRRVTVIQLGSLDDETLRGCPVFNCYGEAVAITLASVENGATSLAIPLDKAVSVLAAMRDGETPSESVLCLLAYKPPQLGIMGEQAQVGEIWGVCVTDFTDLSSDCASKLRVGDLIWKIGNTIVGDVGALRTQMEFYRAGDTVEVYVYRNGQALSFFVTVM